jgi:hypothetical protein
MESVVLIGLVPLVLVVMADIWVYRDARARVNTRREVEATIGTWRIATPETWLGGCALLFLIIFPIYLVARRASE